MQVSYEVGSSRSEQEISTTKRITFVTCNAFFQITKHASFVLNLHRVLTIFNKQPEEDQNYAYIQLKEQND